MPPCAASGRGRVCRPESTVLVDLQDPPLKSAEGYRSALANPCYHISHRSVGILREKGATETLPLFEGATVGLVGLVRATCNANSHSMPPVSNSDIFVSHYRFLFVLVSQPVLVSELL